MNFLFIGDTNVGKTSIINYLLGEKKIDNPITIGTRIRSGPLRGQKKKYYLIDTGEFFINETNIYSHLYRVAGIFIVYDIRNFDSFIHAKRIYKRLIHYCSGSIRKYPIILLANKSEDTFNKELQWGYTRINEDGNEIEMIKVSAKTGLNIDSAFNRCVSEFEKIKNSYVIFDENTADLQSNGYYIAHETKIQAKYINWVSWVWYKIINCCSLRFRKK